jgi:outer membrane protein assembly factor BamB
MWTTNFRHGRYFVALGMWLAASVPTLLCAETFKSGDRIILETLDNMVGPRWLDGRTHDATVGLAPAYGAPFTGTLWELIEHDDRSFELRSLGLVEGPRILGVRAADGTVELVTAGTDTPFNRWRIDEIETEIFTLQNLGQPESRRLLDGRTEGGMVSTESGTIVVPVSSRWRVHRNVPINVLTQHNDIARSGANLFETILEPSVVRAGRFGKIFERRVDGQIYAQPLYVSGLTIPGKGIHNVVFGATTLNRVYAFDADDPDQSAPLWESEQLGVPLHRANLIEFSLIDPAIGIVGTPVIDLSTNTMYLVAKSKTLDPILSLGEIVPNNRLAFESELGVLLGPRWLDGRVQDITVGLARNTEFPFTGTVWEVQGNADAGFIFRNHGHLVPPPPPPPQPPPNVFLDGRSQDGSVGLAPATTGVFTGTLWKIVEAGGGRFNLISQGTAPGPKVLNAGDGTVGLVATTGGGIFGGAGTRWLIHRLNFHNRLYALDLANGQVKRSIEIEGTTAGTVFDPQWHMNRPGLLLMNGIVYVAFGAHADTGPWHGWVFGYHAETFSPAGIHVTTPEPHGGGGVWQAGNGLLGDPEGFIYFLTGNGDPVGPPPPADVRNSFVKLRAQNDTLTVAASFPPVHRPELDRCDIDLGSAGPIRLPGTRLIAGAGKEGILYLLDSDTLKEVHQFQATFRQYPPDYDPPKRPCPTDPNIPFDFQVMYFYPHVHGSPVVWPLGENGASRLYLWAEQDVIRSFTFDPVRSRFIAHAGRTKAPEHSMPGGVLSLSGDSKARDKAIVWAAIPVDCSDNNSVRLMGNRSCNGENLRVNGVLHAFEAATLEDIWDSERNASDRLGFLGKFSPPTIAHGRVYLGTSGDPAAPACDDSHCPSKLVVYGVIPGR